MSGTKVELNMDGLSQAVRPEIQRITAEVAARCGDGFKGDVVQTDRPHGAVRAVTRKARARNARENTLLKAVLS